MNRCKVLNNNYTGSVKITVPKRRAVGYLLGVHRVLLTLTNPLYLALIISLLLKHSLILLQTVPFCPTTYKLRILLGSALEMQGKTMDPEKIERMPRFHDNNWRTFRMRSCFSAKLESSVSEISYSFMRASAFCTVTLRALP